MNCLLLSAGKGERLLPKTEVLPKCLLPMTEYGTMLNYWITLLSDISIDTIFINVFWKKELIIEYVRKLSPRLRNKVSFYSEEYLEPVGMVLANLNHRNLGKEFLVVNSDTYIERPLVKIFVEKTSTTSEVPICLGTSLQADVFGKSRIIINKNGVVAKFEEKPMEGSGLSYAGILKMHHSVFNEFSLIELKKKELTQDILPAFVGRMSISNVGFIMDIGGSIDAYDYAKRVLGGGST